MLLRADLSSKRFSKTKIEADCLQQFLGGRGLGAKLLYEELDPGVNPLSPTNKLIFMTSPLMTTGALSCVKYCVVTKSPLSNTILMTLAGGYFGPELSLTGHLGIVVEGRSDTPVYLWIHDDGVEFRDASALMGLTTSETQSRIRNELGDERIRIACVGPAAEKGVRFASIISDRRACGRGGAGLVMASKNLKAIAVRGSQKAPVMHSAAFKAILTRIQKKYRESDSIKDFGRLSTPGVFEEVNERGLLPTHNYQKGTFPGARNLDSDALEAFVVKKVTCYGCPVRCGNIAEVKAGPYAGAITEGPEYESLVLLGSACGNDCLESIIAADQICDDLGLDTMSTGNAIAFAMECFERGIISQNETDGLALTFGNDRAIVELVKKIGLRSGFGDVLAEGVRLAAQRIGGGAEKLAMHVKGLEMPGYDPRGAKATGLGIATSPRGGCHERGLVGRETFGSPPPIDRLGVAGKAEILKGVQDWTAVQDALGLCVFPVQLGGMDVEDIAEMFSAVTGCECDADALLEKGEAIWNLERLFNIREGFGRKDDRLPERFLTESLEEGNSAGQVFEMDTLLDDYYEARGWDENGVPTKRKLLQLGLHKYVDND